MCQRIFDFGPGILTQQCRMTLMVLTPPGVNETAELYSSASLKLWRFWQ